MEDFAKDSAIVWFMFKYHSEQLRKHLYMVQKERQGGHLEDLLLSRQEMMLTTQISPVLMIGGDLELRVWFKMSSIGVDAITEDG